MTITIAGFVLLDIAYMAVVVNYSIQCQLLVYLVRSIGERTRFKEWGLDQAIKVGGSTNNDTLPEYSGKVW